jgi:hypothetical protein
MSSDPTIPPTSSRFEPDGNGQSGPGEATEGFKPSVQAAIHSLNESKVYFLHMLSAKADGVKASLRLWVLYAFLGVFGILVAGTVAITATVLLVIGVAGGVAAMMGGRTWLANLLVGAIFIVVVSVGMTFGYPLLTGRLRRATVRKYEAMKRKEKTMFGHTAEEKAHEPRAH